MVDVLDNCDDPVIHIGNSNEVSMVDSENVVTTDLLSIFCLTSHHHHLITGHSAMIVI